MHDVIDTCGVDALMPANGVTKLSNYRRDVPLDVYHTARIVAARYGDCGPCLQLTATMAAQAGVAAQTIRAALTGDREALSEPCRLAYDFARSVLDRDGWDGAARAELRARYGPRAILSLAYGICAASFYPTFKYALGAAHACGKIRVGDAEIVPQPR
jgi:alkylhydroperoxidase family enzyme